MAIRLITFDLDDTLWSLKPVLLRAERRAETWLQARFPVVTERWTRERLFALRQQLIEREPALRHRISALRRTTLYEALVDSGVSAAEAGEAADEAFALFHEARHEVELFDDVESCLLELSQTYRLAALTNGNADIFRLELGGLFDFAIRAEEIDSSKPEPLMFLTAQQRAAVQISEMVHVGDHADNDVAAARQLGITAIWANLDGNTWSGTYTPDAEFTRFRDLPPLVRALDTATGGGTTD